jgi:hypothetical protein
MKIYTKINYKWLDGQLVKTSSKSFEYEGDLTLCGGGGGGGGKGGGGGGDGGTLGAITSSVSDTVTDVVTDPIGTTSDVLTEVATDPVGTIKDVIGDTADTVGGSIAEGTGIVGDNLQTAVEMGSDNLADGVSSLALNEGFATTLGDMGDNLNTNMAPLVRAGDQVTQYSLDRINAGMDYMGKTAGHLTDFIHGKSNPSDVTIDPDKFAVDSSKKKKNKSELAVNKAKKRSRKSLRIG